jgi:cell division protein FtsB
LRTLYEQEAQSVKSLDEKLTASRNETKDLQTKIAMIEGSYQDLQNQHRQTAAALQADQQENASLKERMRVMNAEITQMKPTLEKLRSDARQQKGLVAINKKQLATNEAEREKMKAEAEELNRSIQEDTKTLAEQARAQSPPHVASPAQVASPAPSSMSANNPFFRRQASTSEISSPPFASPAHQTDRSFENVFGPAFGGTVASPALGGPQPVSAMVLTLHQYQIHFHVQQLDTVSFPLQGLLPLPPPIESFPLRNLPYHHHQSQERSAQAFFLSQVMKIPSPHHDKSQPRTVDLGRILLGPIHLPTI